MADKAADTTNPLSDESDFPGVTDTTTNAADATGATDATDATSSTPSTAPTTTSETQEELELSTRNIAFLELPQWARVAETEGKLL